ncbi:MAG: transposase [Sandaracinaceae bacterium]|nr:transposase [Sandaracinaceae bacterium]
MLIDPGRHVLFEYTRNHTNDTVDSLLAGYEGHLVADAHVVYDHLYDRGDVVEVNCWAHSRRYFFKAMASDPERAGEALRMQGLLFKIERSIKDAPRKKREAIRAKHSAPVVERFFSWCDAEWERALEDTPMYAALRYARNRRRARERLLHLPDRELSHGRRRAVGIPARPLLPAPQLARAPRAGPGARALGDDPPARRCRRAPRGRSVPRRYPLTDRSAPTGHERSVKDPRRDDHANRTKEIPGKKWHLSKKFRHLHFQHSIQ